MAIVDLANPGRRLLRPTLATLAGLLLCGAALLTGGATRASAATCPNEALREGQVSAALPNGTTYLPECMALELVSPAKKYNQYAIRPNFSATGERIQFASLAALADTPKLGFLFDPYVATRTPGGWQTEAAASPPEILIGTDIRATPCSYSADLSHWAYWGSTASQGPVGITTPFHGGLGGFFGSLGPTIAPLTGTGQFAVGNGKCEGASGDARQLLFSFGEGAGFTYLPGEPVPLGQRGNVYKAFLDQGVPSLALVQEDKNGDFHGGSCGGIVGGPKSDLGESAMKRGAVSPDGSRIYFTIRQGQPEGVFCNPVAHKERIMLRLETPSGPEISGLIADECDRVAPACSAVDGDDLFRGASQEGTRVIFLSDRQLADSDLDEARDLYLYDATHNPGERLTQVSAGDGTGPTPGAGAEMLGVTDFSGDASRIYFAAKDVLTTATNLAGESAQAGTPNLYLYEQSAAHPSGHTAFIATLAPEDGELWRGSPGEANQAMAVPRLGAAAEDQNAGGDGHLLVFASKDSITGDDTDGGKVDVYRYDSETAVIERISIAAPGGEDNGPFDVTITPVFGKKPGAQSVSFGRWVSEDGDSIVYMSEEQLSPLDANNTDNAYLWRDGEVAPLPAPAEATLSEPVISMSGRSIAFVTTDPLLPEDGDSAKDVYVARAEGGFPPPPPPVICEGEACQGPAPRPGEVPLSSGQQTAGNPKPAPACRKGFARKRGRCVKAHKKLHKQGKSHREQGGRR